MTSATAIRLQPRGNRGIAGLINEPLIVGTSVAWQRADGSYMPPVNYQGSAGPAGATQVFATKAQAEGAIVSDGITTIELRGYWEYGLGGGVYKLVFAEPAHAGKVATNGGTKWWELVELRPHAFQFGAKVEAGYSNKDAINAMIVYSRARGVQDALIPAGTFEAKDINLSAGIDATSAATRRATSPLRLRGISPEISVLKLEPGGGHMIDILGTFDKPGITIEDLGIDCNKEPVGVGLFAEYVTALHLRRVHVRRNFIWALIIGTVSSHDAVPHNFDCVVEDCKVIDGWLTYEQLALMNATNTKVNRCNFIAGSNPKANVKAATTANITLSGAQTIDGVSILAGDRVLVKDQSTASQNGIYVAAAGAWTRASDFDAWGEMPLALVFSSGGTLNTASFMCTVDEGGTLGTTPIAFALSAAHAIGIYQIIKGLTVTGTRISGFKGGKAVYGCVGCDDVTFDDCDFEDNITAFGGLTDSDQENLGTFGRGDGRNWKFVRSRWRGNTTAIELGAVRGYEISGNLFEGQLQNTIVLNKGSAVHYPGFIPINGTIRDNEFRSNNTLHQAPQLARAPIFFDLASASIGDAAVTVDLGTVIQANMFEDTHLGTVEDPHTQDIPIGFAGPGGGATVHNLHVINNKLSAYNGAASITTFQTTLGGTCVTTPNMSVT
jgi:hypothetical protein